MVLSLGNHLDTEDSGPPREDLMEEGEEEEGEQMWKKVSVLVEISEWDAVQEHGSGFSSHLYWYSYSRDT